VLGPHVCYGLAEVVVDGRQFTAVVIDVTSKLEVHRREPLARVARLIEPLSRGPVVVMGDFNTPTDSPHLAGIRARYRNAFEEAGYGSSATWPVPLPVLAIDQVWLGGAVQAQRAEHVASRWSDHQAVRTALVFPQGSARHRPAPTLGGGSGSEDHPVLISGRRTGSVLATPRTAP
jgi:endonuclease/exonuclease/phosphatase (EEP) superfamily protein YafD